MNKPNIIEITNYLVSYINSISILILSSLIFITNIILNYYIDIYIIMFVLILFIINLIIINKNLKKYKEITQTKIEITKKDKRYLEYFNKNYIRSKYFSLIYIFIFIISFLLLIFIREKSELLTISLVYTLLLMITLFIRKILLRKDYKNIKTTIKDIEEKKVSKKNIILKTIFKSIINVLIITSIYAIYNNAWYSSWLIGIFSSVVIILKTLINNPCNEFYIYKKKRITTKILNILLTILVLSGIYITLILATPFLLDYITNTEEIEHKDYKIEFIDNKYKIYKNDNSDFKVLQLSDIHIGGSYTTKNKDLKALETVKTLVNETKPDFIIITGDLVYPIGVQTFTWNNKRSFFELCYFMNNLGIPWTFTYGNHDTERLATSNVNYLEYNVFDTTKINNNYGLKGKLLYYNDDKEVDGRSNMVIELINSNNKINTVFYLIDSNSYINNNFSNYDFVHESQVEWYKNKVNEIGKNIPSMIFTHIPLPETKEAIELYENNSSDVKYYFGDVNEEVCTTKNNSTLFDTVVSLGSTKAIFYGHDHYNNISLDYKGIRLTYGMSIDYLASPGIENKTSQRGATLITIKNDSSFDIKQIKYQKSTQ